MSEANEEKTTVAEPEQGEVNDRTPEQPKAPEGVSASPEATATVRNDDGSKEEVKVEVVADEVDVEQDVITMRPGEESPKMKYFTKGMGKSGLTKEKLIEEVRQYNGMLGTIARRHGVTVSAISHRVHNDPDIKREYDTVKELLVDMAENALLKNIKAGDQRAIEFFLKCKGGYVEKHHFELDGGTAPAPLTFVLPGRDVISAARMAKAEIAEHAAIEENREDGMKEEPGEE